MPYLKLKKNMIRSRIKEATPCLGKEPYTLSDWRVSFEELYV
jgi:hypothetical protein